MDDKEIESGRELSNRQREILALLHLSNALIARRLHTSKESVRYHIKQILKKYSPLGRQDLIAEAHQLGGADIAKRLIKARDLLIENHLPHKGSEQCPTCQAITEIKAALGNARGQGCE